MIDRVESRIKPKETWNILAQKSSEDDSAIELNVIDESQSGFGCEYVGPHNPQMGEKYVMGLCGVYEVVWVERIEDQKYKFGLKQVQRSKSTGHEQRRERRFNSTQTQQIELRKISKTQGQLKVYSALIIDESASGYGCIIEGGDPPKPGDQYVIDNHSTCTIQWVSEEKPNRYSFGVHVA